MFNWLENAHNILPRVNTSEQHSGALWLGNYHATWDTDFLLKNNISVIINCTPDIPYIYEVNSAACQELKQLETFRIPVEDSLLPIDINLMEKYYHIVLPFILKKLILEKKNVIVNCRAGKQRSCSVIALVLFTIISNDLLIHNSLPKKDRGPQLMRDIIKFIMYKRPQAFSWGFRINFKKSLEMFFGFEF